MGTEAAAKALTLSLFKLLIDFCDMTKLPLPLLLLIPVGLGFATTEASAQETDTGPFRHVPAATAVDSKVPASADNGWPASEPNPISPAAEFPRPSTLTRETLPDGEPPDALPEQRPALPLGRLRAQGTDDLPLIPADGTCPELRGSVKKRTFREYRVELHGARTRQIILPEAQMFANDTRTAPLPGRSLRFGSDVTVLRWNQGELNSHLVKITTDKGPRCGWIANDALLDRNRPLPIETLRAEGIDGFTGNGSTLDAKVLVRNRFDKGAVETTTGTRVYYQYTDPDPYDTLTGFNVLNVFDYAEHDGQTWFFVGGERATEDGGVRQVLYGWVQADEVIPWNSWVTVYPAPDKQNVRIYENTMEAERDGEWLAVLGNERPPLDRNFARFPLLDTLYLPGLTLHRIVFPGTACDSRGHCSSAQPQTMARVALGDKLWKAEYMDVLFVMDATEGMQRYFRPVVEGMRDFLREAEPKARNQVRYSLVVYGDFLQADDGRGGFQFARVLPFGMPDAEQRLDFLLRASAFEDPMKDLPNAAFGALSKGIREAAWRDRAGWRVVVWIGDQPNRSAELTGHRRIAYAEEDVMRALRDVNAVFAAINVRGDYHPVFNDLFMQQAGAILAETDWGLPPRRAYDKGTITEMPEQVTESVKDILSGIFTAAREVPELVKAMAAGTDLDEVDAEHGWPSVRLSNRYMEERLGMDDDAIHEFFRRGQLVREGWIRQVPEDPDFEYWLSLKPDEMADIVTSAEVLCETLSDSSPDFNEVRDAMVATLRNVTGDVPRLEGPADETNIRLFLSKRLHVPKEEFSALLGKDIDGFMNWFKNADPDEREGFSDRICKKAALLRMAQNGLRADAGIADVEFDKRLRVWGPKEGSTRPFNWVWGTEFGIHYYSIPLRYVF